MSECLSLISPLTNFPIIHNSCRVLRRCILFQLCFFFLEKINDVWKISCSVASRNGCVQLIRLVKWLDTTTHLTEIVGRTYFQCCVVVIYKKSPCVLPVNYFRMNINAIYHMMWKTSMSKTYLAYLMSMKDRVKLACHVLLQLAYARTGWKCIHFSWVTLQTTITF